MRMQNLLLMLLLPLAAVIAISSGAGEKIIRTIDFSQVKTGKNSTILPAENNSAKKILCVKEWIDFGNVDIPGKGNWRKIKVAFRARLAGENTMENNPLYAIAPETADLTRFSIQQLKESGDNQGLFTRSFIRPWIVSSEWTDCGRIFYMEPDAVKIKISMGPGNGISELFIGEITISEIIEENIMPNGDFAMGPYNYSGIKGFERTGMIEPGKDGRGQLNTCPFGAAYTDILPLKGKTNYRITIEWNNPAQNNLRVHNYFRDKNGKVIQEYHWYGNKPKGKMPEKESYISQNEFVTESEVTNGYIYFYRGIIKSIRLEEIKK